MSNVPEQFYDFLTEEDEPKACEAIPDEACTNVPKNFTLNVANGTLTKLAEKIISPNLTLAWIMDYLGASSALVGALVPVKDAGSLLPQLIVSGKIRAYQIRKSFWVAAAVIQGVCWLLASLLIFFYTGNFITWVLLGLLAIFSLASGVGSISFKDVIAKTIPKTTRGQMLSYRSTFGGLLGLIAGVLLVFVIKSDADQTIYASLFLVASVLWLVAAILFYLINEEKGATKGGRNPIMESKAGVQLIKEDKNFRNFLITRALLMAIPLLTPFYVLIAKSTTDTSWSFLGYLIIVSGLAQVISSPFWGKLADQSVTMLMRISSLIAIGAAAYALVFYTFTDLGLGFYAFLPVFFINGIAYSGARLSRKTYLVNFAPDDDRPTYVSVANTVIGLFTLVASTFGIIAEYFGLPAQVIFFVVLLLLAVFFSYQLKKI